MPTKVVHVSKSRYDIYIGRGLCPITDMPSKWGNPFLISKQCSRMDCIRKHASWLINQSSLISSLHELKDKTLGCWCVPNACHGHILAALADMSDLDSEGNSVIPNNALNQLKQKGLLGKAI